MPACVVVVHDEPEFAEQIAARLRLTGHEATAFLDPVAALIALEAAQRVGVLISTAGTADIREGPPNDKVNVRRAQLVPAVIFSVALWLSLALWPSVRNLLRIRRFSLMIFMVRHSVSR